MKKFLSVVLLLLLFTVPCFAHPGRLDSDGGHWNHDTGEYHYHSGENTGRSDNDSVSSSKNHIDYYSEIGNDEKSIDYELIERNTEISKEPSSTLVEDSRPKYSVIDIVSIILMFLFFGLFILLFVFVYVCPLFALYFKNSKPKDNPILTTDSNNTIEDNLSEPNEKSNEPNCSSSPPYKSLIPELIHTSEDDGLLIVGTNISSNKTFFSPCNQSEPAFIRVYTSSGKEVYDLPVYRDNQYITLMSGERIKLINCQLCVKE